MVLPLSRCCVTVYVLVWQLGHLAFYPRWLHPRPAKDLRHSCQFLISSRHWTNTNTYAPTVRTPPGAMDSPPSHPTDGLSPLGISTEARDRKERDSPYAQIQNSNRGRQVVNFDGPDEYFSKSSTGANIDGSNNDGGLTRTPLVTSSAQSLYTQHPTIDFDNLSWPSR